AEERPARDGDPNARVPVGAAKALRRQELVDRPDEGRLDVAGERDREPSRRPAQPRCVLGQLRGASPAGPQRLEYAVSELESAIERRQDRLRRLDDATVHPDVTWRRAHHRGRLNRGPTTGRHAVPAAARHATRSPAPVTRTPPRDRRSRRAGPAPSPLSRPTLLPDRSRR